MRIPTTSEETGHLIEAFRQQGRDSQHIEVKAAAHGLPKSIVETLGIQQRFGWLDCSWTR